MIGRGDQIINVRRERRIGELTLTGAEPSEIKTQRRNAVKFQPFGSATRGPVSVLSPSVRDLAMQLN
jgi:hypothetical protein